MLPCDVLLRLFNLPTYPNQTFTFLGKWSKMAVTGTLDNYYEYHYEMETS